MPSILFTETTTSNCTVATVRDDDILEDSEIYQFHAEAESSDIVVDEAVIIVTLSDNDSEFNYIIS